TDLVHHAPCPFTIGRALRLREGGDVTIVTCGAHPTLMALEAHAALRAGGIEARVLDMHTLKPIDEDALVAAAAETGGIVTVEEHGPAGGLGGAVAEVVSERMPCRVLRVALPEPWPDRVGDQRELLERSGVTPARIASAAASLVRRRLSPTAR
ncbi:MAG TPA: transketolase C-terminal domain-containing protein, partial [Candidatus Dormibacteraeota bacterium]|nr:transketolase C-terminal domain-containing protein [Candidatus Dormibacteraeota bacterium]